MTLETKENSLAVTGNLTTSSDFDSIKKALEAVSAQHKVLHLTFHDALVINSSLIGYLVNLINQKSIQIHMNVGNDTLFELIDYLGMNKMFHLKKI